MRIEYLADHPDLVPQLARLHFAEWGYLRPHETLEGRIDRLRGCLGRSAIPMVVIAIDGDELCGSAMLVAHDMDSRPELTPWLAGVFVIPSMRERGVGEALVERIVAEALTLGIPTIYLYTPSKEEFYARRGWTLLERCEYRGAQVAVMSKPLVA